MIKVVYERAVACPITAATVKKIVTTAAGLEKKIRGEVTITVVGEAAIRRLNRDYRGKDKVTDVISFGWQEDSVVPSDSLGEIYLCYAQIKRQAPEFGATAKEEFARMLVHGLLHIVGYDHVTPAQAKKMFPLQEKIVARV